MRPGLVTVTVDGAEVGGAHSVALSGRVLTCACPASLSWAAEALAVATRIFTLGRTPGHTRFASDASKVAAGALAWGAIG